MPIYLLIYDISHRAEVDRAMAPLLSRPSVVHGRERDGRYEVRSEDRELMRRIWQITRQRVVGHAVEDQH